MRKAYVSAFSVILFVCFSGLMWADPIQVTAGVNTLGLCVTNCDASPNPLVQNNIGVYSVSGTGAFNEELIVLLLPNNGGSSATTSFFSSDPISTITTYNPYPGPGVVGGSSKFAPSGTFGLGSGTASQVTPGYWGEITGNSGSTKVGSFLGVALSPSINMANVASESGFNFGTATPVFGVYTLLVNAAVGSNGLLDLGLSTDMPLGTFVAVEACQTSVTAPPTECVANPNSSAGVADIPPSTVPEPGSLLLLGTGLLGLGLLVRRKRAPVV